MAEIPLQTLEELDLTAEEFEELVIEGLGNAVQRVMDTDDIEQALADADQGALDAMLVFWAAYVTQTLVPALDISMIDAGLQVVSRLVDATDNPLSLLIDQPLDTSQYLQQATNRLVNIGNELWFNARTSIAEGIALGESQPKLAQRVRDAIGVTEPRARTIARTESHGARNVSAMATLQQFESGYGIEPGVMRKQWQATNDVRTRPTHHEADGQTVPFSSPFMVGGVSLAFPGDPSGPADTVINCRCATLAVFDPADLNLNDSGTVVTLNAAAYTEDTDMAVPERNVAPWSGVITVEGVTTGEYPKRQYAVGSLTWPELGATESLEIPLGWKYERAHGGIDTGNTVDVGRIDSIERIGNELHARGVLDLDSPYGREAARQMGTRMNPGFLAGVSIVADDPEHAEVEYVMPEGCAEDMDPADMAPQCLMPEEEIYHSGRIRTADLVSIPAFVEGRIYLDDDTEVPDDEPAEEEIVTASAYTITIPDLPPADWFAEPKEVPEIGAITVTEDGRFFGYLAPRQVAHRGYRDKRVTVPTGNVDYGIWMNRATMVDDGKGSFAKLATGPITMDCGHAPMGPKGAPRREHYDNACSVVATARVGENSRGVWIAGALIPGINAEQVSRMMACQLSGDWGPHRERPGKRELAAALLVPVPGFPTRSFSMRGGELMHTRTPVRFGTYAGVDEPIGLRAAANRIAEQVGLDPQTRMKEFASQLRDTQKGDK